jgi:hypothetical protein
MSNNITETITNKRDINEYVLQQNINYAQSKDIMPKTNILPTKFVQRLMLYNIESKFEKIINFIRNIKFKAPVKEITNITETAAIKLTGFEVEISKNVKSKNTKSKSKSKNKAKSKNKSKNTSKNNESTSLLTYGKYGDTYVGVCNNYNFDKPERVIHLCIATSAMSDPLWLRSKRVLKYWTYCFFKFESDPDNIYVHGSDKDEGVFFNLWKNKIVRFENNNLIDGKIMSPFSFDIRNLVGQFNGHPTKYYYTQWETGKIYGSGPLSEFYHYPVLSNSLFDNSVNEYIKNHIKTKWVNNIVWIRNCMKNLKIKDIGLDYFATHFITTPSSSSVQNISSNVKYISIMLIVSFKYTQTIFGYISTSDYGVQHDVINELGDIYCTPHNIICGEKFVKNKNPYIVYNGADPMTTVYQYTDFDTGVIYDNGTIINYNKTYLQTQK